MEIRKVLSKKDLKRFITFPHQLYKRDGNYVPTLNIVTKNMLNHNNPFLKHSEIARTCKPYHQRFLRLLNRRGSISSHDFNALQ